MGKRVTSVHLRVSENLVLRCQHQHHLWRLGAVLLAILTRKVLATAAGAGPQAAMQAARRAAVSGPPRQCGHVQVLHLVLLLLGPVGGPHGSLPRARPVPDLELDLRTESLRGCSAMQERTDGQVRSALQHRLSL